MIISAQHVIENAHTVSWLAEYSIEIQAISAILMFSATFVLAWVTWRYVSYSREMAKTMKEQFIESQRPKIHIENISPRHDLKKPDLIYFDIIYSTKSFDPVFINRLEIGRLKSRKMGERAIFKIEVSQSNNNNMQEIMPYITKDEVGDDQLLEFYIVYNSVYYNQVYTTKIEFDFHKYSPTKSKIIGISSGLYDKVK